MNKIITYPKCAHSFRQFYSQDNLILNKFIYKLINVRHFDVTLRDGLQGLSNEEQNNLKLIDKSKLYYYIKQNYEPINMEIGSIVSNKILPVFQDSDSLYNYIEYFQLNQYKPKTKNFILIPNEKCFNKIDKFIGLNCFSFITSVSESFQMKNTNMSLDTTFKQLNNMILSKQENHTIKLYVSCINECPIEGKIDNNIVIEKIFKYQELKPDILCLSDTCGTLTKEDLTYIINKITQKHYNNLSLHLHVKPGREDEVEQIIHTALDLGITCFDVSALKSGGCSVTMNKSELLQNLSYELYYKSLTTYLLRD
jgi:hydroxymethylglutaryl-CoA lyase